jgi:hypothetical protein
VSPVVLREYQAQNLSSGIAVPDGASQTGTEKTFNLLSDVGKEHPYAFLHSADFATPKLVPDNLK